MKKKAFKLKSFKLYIIIHLSIFIHTLQIVNKHYLFISLFFLPLLKSLNAIFM